MRYAPQGNSAPVRCTCAMFRCGVTDEGTRGTRELLKTLLRNIFPTFSAGSARRVRTRNRLIVTFLNPVLLLNFLFSCEFLVRSQKSA